MKKSKSIKKVISKKSTVRIPDYFSNLLRSLAGTVEPNFDERVLLLEKSYNIQFPEQLRFFLSAVIKSEKGVDFREWKLEPGEIVDYSEKTGKNVFEELVLLDQEDYLGTWMMEIFTETIYIGSLGNGDRFYVNLAYDREKQKILKKTEVLFFNHETYAIENTFADSIESLATAATILDQYKSSEKTDTEKLKKIMLSLKKKVNLSWHYEDLETASGVLPSMEDSMETMLAKWNHYRSLWVAYMLRDDGIHTLSDCLGIFLQAQKIFEEKRHEPYNMQNVIKILKGDSKAGTAISSVRYLWEAYFSEPEKLEEVAGLIKTRNPSPMVQDAISLALSFHRGERKSLGKIGDLPALQKKFMNALVSRKTTIPPR